MEAMLDYRYGSPVGPGTARRLRIPVLLVLVGLLAATANGEAVLDSTGREIPPAPEVPAGELTAETRTTSTC